jgi:ribose transport system substrate-binding protein
MAAALSVLGVAEAAETPKFALIPDSIGNWYSDQLRLGCTDAAKKLGVDCVYNGPSVSGDVEQQLVIFKDFISKKVDGAAIEPSHPEAILPALKAANDAKIPIVTFGPDLPEQYRSLSASHLGPNNFQIGVGLASLLRQLKPKGGSICVIQDFPEEVAFQKRLKGVRDTLAGSISSEPQGKRLVGKNGWVEPDGCPIFAKGDANQTYSLVDRVLNKVPAIDAFVMTSDFLQSDPNTYEAMLSKYQDRIKSGELTFVGAGTSPKQIDLVEKGFSSGQIGLQPSRIGYTAIELLYNAAHGRIIPAQVELSPDVCTRQGGKACEQKISCDDDEIVCNDDTCRPTCN